VLVLRACALEVVELPLEVASLVLTGDSSVEERRFRVVVLAAAGAAVDPSAKDAAHIGGVVEMLPAWHCDGAHASLLVPPPKRLAANAIRLDDARRRYKLGCVNLGALVRSLPSASQRPAI
jgi:hypothetical protein